MRLRKLLQRVSEVTLIRPGDGVVFRVPSNTSPQQAHELHAKLKNRLPDVEIIIAAGIDSVDVLRKVAS